MSNLTVENVYTRHKAKELAKKHFWKLLAMTLIVVVIAYGISFGGMMLLARLTGQEVNVTTTTTYYSASPAFIIGYLVLMLVNMMISGGLGLGMTSAMIDLCRGEEITVGRVSSRMGQCLKALGLSLWVSLKIILWALPAYVLIGVGFAFVIMTENELLAALLPLCSLVLIIALVVPAALRYMLATYVLADKPETSVFTCVKDSKALMKGHKWQVFKLAVPPLLIMYLLMLAAILVIALVLSVVVELSPALTVILSIAMLLGIFTLVMYFVIRVGLGYCIFYLNREGENAPAEAAAEEPAEA